MTRHSRESRRVGGLRKYAERATERIRRSPEVTRGNLGPESRRLQGGGGFKTLGFFRIEDGARDKFLHCTSALAGPSVLFEIEEARELRQ
jgi:hypothetical protein